MTVNQNDAIGTKTNPFKITVKQNPIMSKKWDIRICHDIDKYHAGEILCTSIYKDYCQHHFLIGDKTNINKLPDVIEITTFKEKTNPSDPDVVDSVLVFDRNAPKVRKVGGGRKKKQINNTTPSNSIASDNTPVVSSNPWAAMLGNAFGVSGSEDLSSDEAENIECDITEKQEG